MSATVEAPNTVATTTIASVYTGNDWLKQQTSTVATAGTTNATTTFYGYDRNGAQTNERVGAAGSVEVNEWQFDGTLASTVTQGQATGGSEFVYDAAGNRLKQRTQIGKPEAKEVRYLVDPNTSYAQVVQERDENNVLQARYAWEDGLAPLVMWRRTNTGAYAAFFYLCDGQDSVRQLTDASGKVTDSYFYDAFGNALQGGSGDTPNPFRYTGQQLDASGDYYLRARYYNSGSGRFLSHDPMMGGASDPISMHRYLYASADGVNFSDPSGKETLAGLMVSVGTWMMFHQREISVAEFGVGFAAGFVLDEQQSQAFDMAQMAATPVVIAGGVSAVGGRRIGRALGTVLGRWRALVKTVTNNLSIFSHSAAGREVAERYYAGIVGDSVRNLDFRGKTVAQARKMLVNAGFVQNPDVTHTSSGPTALMELWEHADGGMARIKPQGVPGHALPHMQKPHVVKAVKANQFLPDSWANEGIKVDHFGGAAPKIDNELSDGFLAQKDTIMQSLHVELR